MSLNFSTINVLFCFSFRALIKLHFSGGNQQQQQKHVDITNSSQYMALWLVEFENIKDSEENRFSVCTLDDKQFN